jgi:hypothetical protein
MCMKCILTDEEHVFDHFRARVKAADRGREQPLNDRAGSW